MVLGVNAGPDSFEILEAFVAAFQITFPVLLDDQNIIAGYRQNGALSPFPLDYIIDQDGNVAYYRTEYEPEAMVAVIEDLLASETAVDDTLPAPVRLVLDTSPNPFNPQTTIRFVLPSAGDVTLDLHDARGRRVRRLLGGESRAAGSHSLTFDGRDGAGRDLSAGVYLLRLQAAGETAVHKLALVR